MNRVWRASAQLCDMVPSGTLWFLREHSGPFGDNMVLSGTIWFLREHSDGGMGWTSAIHRGDFLGLETSILLMTCYMFFEWLSMRFMVLSGNTIYTGIPNHMIICSLSRALCICIRYSLSFILTNILILQRVLMLR